MLLLRQLKLKVTRRVFKPDLTALIQDLSEQDCYNTQIKDVYLVLRDLSVSSGCSAWRSYESATQTALGSALDTWSLASILKSELVETLGNSEGTFSFAVGRSSYSIDLVKMEQTNVATATARAVRRRRAL